MDGLRVELTIMCTVADIEEAQDALHNAAEGYKKAGWEIKDAWLHAIDNDSKECADGAEAGRA